MPTAKDLMKRISKMEKEIEKMKSKIQEDTESMFKLSFKEIFEKHSKLESFSWVQYTPNWNDGDECVFSAHTDYVYLNGSEDESVCLQELEALYKDVLNKDKAIKKLTNENVRLAKKGNTKWQIDHNNQRISEIQNSDLDEVSWKYLALEDITGVLSSVDDDIFRDMFSDHVKVTVSRNGIETESYEHD